MSYSDLNESPIQRLQREWREYHAISRSHLDVTHKCVAAIDGLVQLDDVQDERLAKIERRLDAMALMFRALTTDPAQTAERILRSVDDGDA